MPCIVIVKKRWKDVKPISEKLWSDLRTLKVKNGHYTDVYAASARVSGGAIIPCALFVQMDTEDQQFLYPRHGFIRSKFEFDDESMVDSATVEKVEPSPYVMPADIFLRLDEHCHYDDRVCHAKLKLRDGKEYWVFKASPGHKHGFFVAVPEGYRSSDIVGLEWATKKFYEADPQVYGNCLDPPKYRLCLFRRPGTDGIG